MSRTYKTSGEAYAAMMKYIELHQEDHFGGIAVVFGRNEYRGDVSWTLTLPEEWAGATPRTRGGRADPVEDDGQRGVKQTLCVRDDTRYDDSRYNGWEYNLMGRAVLYYYVVDPYCNTRYLVAPPSLDEPYDDEYGDRRYGGPKPKLLGDFDESEDLEDSTTATGLNSDGESRAEGWNEYGPDANQFD
jgi:hypothetical protein